MECNKTLDLIIVLYGLVVSVYHWDWYWDWEFRESLIYEYDNLESRV